MILISVRSLEDFNRSISAVLREKYATSDPEIKAEQIKSIAITINEIIISKDIG